MERSPGTDVDLNKIEGYFRSPDKEMWKLGQRLCHKYRIDYFVHCTLKAVTARLNGRKGMEVNKALFTMQRYSMSSERTDGKTTFGFDGKTYDFNPIYKIGFKHKK